MSIIYRYDGSSVTGLSITTPGSTGGTGITATTLGGVDVIQHFRDNTAYGQSFNVLGFRTQGNTSALGHVIYAQVYFAVNTTDFFILTKNADNINYNADGRGYFYFDTGANLRFGDSGAQRGTMAATTATYYDLKWEVVAGGELHGYARVAPTPGVVVNDAAAWTDMGTTIGQLAEPATLYVVTNQYNAGTAGTKSCYVSEIAYTSDGALNPPAPSTLAGTGISSSRIDLTWSDASVTTTNADVLSLERSTLPSSGFSEVATPAIGDQAYSDTGLDSGTSYYYRIRAKITIGGVDYYSDYSSTASAASNSVAAGTRKTLLAQGCL